MWCYHPNMTELRADLEESRDFWQGSAEHDKKQMKLSLYLGAAGVYLSGASSVAAGAGLFSGDILMTSAGAAGLFSGGLMTLIGADQLREEFKNFTKMQSRTAVREQEISELED